MREEHRLTVWRVLAVGLMGAGMSHWTDHCVWAALFDEWHDEVRPGSPSPYAGRTWRAGETRAGLAPDGAPRDG
ncbi:MULTISPECIES: hypothetical protein [unclassified Streptomyces]|uniref:hypothetical protein n=1 Tax=unclassified Streptomyces TaxID=2593676 RepID=UPI00129A7866|nr:hypothetical protein [Streptomyces sp. SUK 48]